jgi:hypothetical protein
LSGRQHRTLMSTKVVQDPKGSLLIVRASRALLFESFAAELWRYTDTAIVARRTATLWLLRPTTSQARRPRAVQGLLSPSESFGIAPRACATANSLSAPSVSRGNRWVARHAPARRVPSRRERGAGPRRRVECGSGITSAEADECRVFWRAWRPSASRISLLVLSPSGSQLSYCVRLQQTFV